MLTSLEQLRSVRPFVAAQRVYRPKPFNRPQVAKGFIPVVATGGVGDLVISLGVCQALSEQYLPVYLWCTYPEVARLFLPPDSSVIVMETPFPGFDYWIKLNCLAIFEFERNFKGFKDPAVEKIHWKWSEFSRSREWGPVMRFHPGIDYEAARLSQALGFARHELPYVLLGMTPQRLCPKVVAGPYDWEPFITVHDGYDTTQEVPVRATKTWSLRHWRELISLLRAEIPGLMVVQLGGKTSRPIPGVDVELISKVSLTEALKILSRSQLHIDGDSGLVHAAHAMGVRSVAMFGPTPADFFGYPENVNLGPASCGGCFWLKENWLNQCALEYGSPICMDSIYPTRVARAALTVLKRYAA
jgi:hypothetical protein